MNNKLKEELDRMRYLSNFKGYHTEYTNIKPIMEDKVLANNGKYYAILKENQKFYIKEAENKENLLAEDFNYIGGLANKNDYAYNSLNSAKRHLELKVKSINESCCNTNIANEYKPITAKEWQSDLSKEFRKELNRFADLVHNMNNIGIDARNKPYTQGLKPSMMDKNDANKPFTIKKTVKLTEEQINRLYEKICNNQNLNEDYIDINDVYGFENYKQPKKKINEKKILSIPLKKKDDIDNNDFIDNSNYIDNNFEEDDNNSFNDFSNNNSDEDLTMDSEFENNENEFEEEDFDNSNFDNNENEEEPDFNFDNNDDNDEFNDSSDNDFNFDDDNNDDADENTDDEDNVSEKSIERLTGKLSQKINEFQKENENSDVMKYTLGMIMSATLKGMSKDDIKDVFNKFKEKKNKLFDED